MAVQISTCVIPGRLIGQLGNSVGEISCCSHVTPEVTVNGEAARYRTLPGEQSRSVLLILLPISNRHIAGQRQPGQPVDPTRGTFRTGNDVAKAVARVKAPKSRV